MKGCDCTQSSLFISLIEPLFSNAEARKINNRCCIQTLTVFFEMELTRTSRSQAVVSCAEINPNGLLHRVKEDLAVTTPEKINQTILGSERHWIKLV